MFILRKINLGFIIFFFGITLMGNEGAKWMDSDLRKLEQSAQEGDSYAQAFLALCYIHGDKGLDISFDKASYWANLSTETNHWLGLFTMGYLHRFAPLGPSPEKVGRFYKQVFADPDGTLVKIFSAGDPVASYVLGEIFTAEEIEPELNPDLQFAAKHYASSSRAGYGPASVQHALLKLHANAIEGQNIDIGKDLAGGISILKEVAEQQLPAGHHFLGRCYFRGIGVEQDYKMALVYFQAAADRGYTTSQLIVAHFYAYGLTGTPKVDVALRYAKLALLHQKDKALEKIAEYEQLLANQSTGNPAPIFTRSDKTVPSPTNPSIAEPPPLPPAPSNLPEPPAFRPTAKTLPSVYSSIEPTIPPEPPAVSVLPEVSVPVPPPPSIPLPRAPTPGGSLSPAVAASSLDLAKKHYFGRGVSLDFNRAFQLFTDSAQSGNPEAARYLGIMYLRGKGVAKNYDKALEWFTKAADGGDELAIKNVKTLKILTSRN
jgi:TPR repeat protein